MIGIKVAKLYFRYSAMNAGKSTAMLQVAHNYEEQGQAVRLFTAAIDDRYGVGHVTSRLGPQRATEVFDANTDFLHLVDQKVACVLVDEAQFLSTCARIFVGNLFPARPTCWRWPTISRKSRISVPAAKKPQ